MKKFFAVCVSILMVVAFASCKKPAGQAAVPEAKVIAPGEAVAVVAGVNITAEELDKAAKGQLQKLDTEIYQIKKRALDQLVEDKLIEDAAKKKGESVEKYVASEIDAKAAKPTEEEIKSFYDSNKDRIGKSFDEAKKQISDMLAQGKKMRARNDLIAGLRKDASVKVNLEPPRVQIDLKGAQFMGDENAKVTLVEFSDYQCPFCKRVRPTIWRLLDEYKGKLRYTFLDFPLSFHKDAKKAHEAARCAGDQKKYYDFNKKIFDNQTNITVDDLKKYAKELELNTKDFDKCLDSGKHSKDVDASVQAGMNVGVSGTPAYFVNGVMLSGAMPYESFKEMIDSELNR